MLPSIPLPFTPLTQLHTLRAAQRDPLQFNATIQWASERVADAWGDRNDSVSSNHHVCPECSGCVVYCCAFSSPLPETARARILSSLVLRSQQASGFYISCFSLEQCCLIFSLLRYPLQTTILCLLKLRSLFQTTRRLLKKMGDSAGVGIEPEAQTALCDATMALPGVVAAAVPGAGGNDAIFALT